MTEADRVANAVCVCAGLASVRNEQRGSVGPHWHGVHSNVRYRR
jgi:hypothetical protein